jgi:GcrA cell cycle regulator
MTLSYLVGQHNSYDTPWTEELVARLKYLWQEGYSAARIVKEIGPGRLTRNAVIGKAHRLKLPERRPRMRMPYKRKHHKPERVAAPPPPPLKSMLPATPTAPPMRRLGLFELAEMQCHFPIGDPTLPGFFFCGADAAQLYCPFHQHMARRPDGRGGQPKITNWSDDWRYRG